MKYQLLVLDIDGTANNSEKQVMEKTKKRIIELQENGIRVVLASGRPPQGVVSVAYELQMDRFGSYILAYNGSKIIECGTGRCIFEKYLPRHLPVSLWKAAKEDGVGFAAYRNDAIVAGTVPDKYMELESKVSSLPIEYHENFGKYMDFPVSQCLITGEPEDLETLEPVLTYKYVHEAQVFHSEPYYLEVTPKNVDKAYGLKHLLNILNIPREEMVCCGDSFNDLTMIQFAGVGVAMANAVDRLKALADYVTVSDNDHDGVAEAIEKFF